MDKPDFTTPWMQPPTRRGYSWASDFGPDHFSFCQHAVKLLFAVPTSASEIQIEWFAEEPADPDVSVVRVCCGSAVWHWSGGRRGWIARCTTRQQQHVLRKLYPCAGYGDVYELFLRCYYKESDE